MLRLIRSIALVVVVVLLSFAAATKIAQASDSECQVDQVVKVAPNTLSFKIDCPPIAEGPNEDYSRHIAFGDNAAYDPVFNADGTLISEHSYAYDVGGIVTYTLSIDYVKGNNVVEYTFPVVIDDTVVNDFAISKVLYDTLQDGTPLWQWSYSIVPTGTYTLSVDSSCNGLAFSNDGHFRYKVEGPIVGGNLFVNTVSKYLVTSPLVPTTIEITDSQGNSVFSQETYAPACSIPEPQIFIEDGPYHPSDYISVTVVPPMGAESMVVNSNHYLSDISFKCDKAEWVNTCPPRVTIFNLSLRNVYTETFYISVTTFFEDSSANSTMGITREIDSDGTNPQCSLSVEKVGDIQYKLSYEWSDGSPSYTPRLWYGFYINKYDDRMNLSGSDGSGSILLDFPVAPSRTFTPTLVVNAYGYGIAAVCEEPVTMPDRFPPPKCDDFDSRVGLAFNKIEFKFKWDRAYFGVPTLEFGDGSRVTLATGDDYPTGNSQWLYNHDYGWNVHTGRGSAVAKLVIPGQTEADDAICEEQVNIVDPSWSSDQVKELYLPSLERSKTN